MPAIATQTEANVTETAAAAPVAAKPVKKAAPKKAAPAKAAKTAKAPAKKAAKASSNGSRAKVIHGVNMPSGKFWNKKRVAIVTALRKLNATSATASRSAEQIAAKAGSEVDAHNVVRYCAEEEPLVAGGIVKRVKMEGAPISYHLTATGAKCSLEG